MLLLNQKESIVRSIKANKKMNSIDKQNIDNNRDHKLKNRIE